MSFLATASLLCVLPLQAPAQDALVGVLDEVRALSGVGGASVGYGGSPGRFYTLGNQLLDLASEDQFLALLDEANPVARSMGLYCLAQTSGKKHIELFVSRLPASEEYLYCPGGCVCYDITEGQFALELLMNVNALNYVSLKPLAEERVLMEIALGIFADDALRNLRYSAGKLLWGEQRPKSLEELRSLAPQLTDTQRVKAVGRLPASDALRGLLMTTLADSSLAPEPRLAAASALTRDVHPAALAAIQNASIWKTLPKGDALRKRFVATMTLHREHQVQVEAMQAVNTWMGLEEIEDVVVAVNTVSHPFGIVALSGTTGKTIWSSHVSVRNAQAASVAAIIEALPNYIQEWNTHSDAPHQLDGFLSEVLGVDEWRLEMPAEERAVFAGLRARLQPFLK